MGFASGSISFRRFAVVGEQPDTVDQDVLDKLAEHALRTPEEGVAAESEYGWSGGRHLLDGVFSFENNVYAEALHFALRIDTNKVPSDLKKAYAAIEEEAVAATNPSGFISKNQKRDVRDIVRRRVDDELRTGRFRRSKLLPVLWDFPSQMLYCAATGSALEQLMEIFERTFGLTLMPMSAGALAMQLLQPKGKRRDYEDLRPTRFVQSAAGEGEWPEYPWVLKGPEPKDFLGNEFLLWLWHESEGNAGSVSCDAGDVSLLFDRSLELDCAYGQTGKDSFRATGPTHMPEAREGLRTGKMPRKAGIIADVSGLQFSFTFNPEAFAATGVNLGKIEDAASPRVLFEERIALLRQFGKLLDSLFEAFLASRASSGWEGRIGKIGRWIRHPSTPSVTVLT